MPTFGRPTMATVAGWSIPLISQSARRETHRAGTAESSQRTAISEYAQRLHRDLRLSDERSRFPLHCRARSLGRVRRRLCARRSQRRRSQHVHGARQRRAASVRPNESLQRAQGPDPSVRLVVTGCLAEQDRDRMQQRAPHVDAIFGTRELAQLGDQLAAWSFDCVRDRLRSSTAPDDVRDNMLRFALGGTADGVTDAFTHLRAFVTVQRGCSYYCTFCIVPHVRGRFDHRPQNAIVEEVRRTDRSRSSRDHARRPNGERMARLRRRRLRRSLPHDRRGLPGLERLTFISPHPKDFTRKDPRRPRRRSAAQPAHSPAPAVGKRCGLATNESQVHAGRLCDGSSNGSEAGCPSCAITTDIIVGFPGETEDDFEATLAYVETGVFANAFTFIYSIRRGTPAARWEQVPRDVALARFTRLCDAQNRVTRAYHDRKVGRVVRALIVGDSKKDASRLTAKTPDNVTIVAPKPPDYPSERRPANTSLRADAVARRRDRKRARLGLHRNGGRASRAIRRRRRARRAADDRSDGAGAANAARVKQHFEGIGDVARRPWPSFRRCSSSTSE